MGLVFVATADHGVMLSVYKSRQAVSAQQLIEIWVRTDRTFEATNAVHDMSMH